MNREEKNQAIQDLKSRFQKATITLLADYKGLKVNEINELRKKLSENSAKMHVVKNTLARLAVEETEMKGLREHFTGTTAVITTEGDPVSSTKALVQFAKDREKPQVKVGFMSGELIDAARVEALSKLPSREEMLAKLMGSMQAPAQNLVNVLAAIPRQLVTVLAAIRDQKE